MAATLLLKLQAFIARCFLRSAPAPALEDDDLLLEILVRLPPLPSSLLRASLVCKRWRRLVSDPGFLRRFRAHHQTPPQLGLFRDGYGPDFTPTLGPPDHIPRARFSLPQHPGERLFFLGCRHGLALLINRRRLEAVVWDPVTGCQRTVAYPPEFTINGGKSCCRGTVLSTAGGDGHGHGHVPGEGPLSPFRLILINMALNSDYTSVLVCLYESETGKWCNISSTVIPSWFSILPSVLVENTLCGFFHWPTGILEFDLDRKSVGIIQKPKSIHSDGDMFFRVVRTQDRGLGIAILAKLSIQLWGRKASSDGIVEWVLQKIIELDKLLVPRPSLDDEWFPRILGFDEDNNVIHLATTTGVFMIQLETMQFTKLFEDRWMYSYYPYTSFFTLGAKVCPPVLPS